MLGSIFGLAKVLKEKLYSQGNSTEYARGVDLSCSFSVSNGGTAIFFQNNFRIITEYCPKAGVTLVNMMNCYEFANI